MTTISGYISKPLRRVAAVLLTLLFVAACGQSGPLYLPGNPSEVQAPSSGSTPVPPSDPRTEEEEDEKDKG